MSQHQNVDSVQQALSNAKAENLSFLSKSLQTELQQQAHTSAAAPPSPHSR
jgi:hypothetical protein